MFRERYRIRSGIEGTNSRLKRRTGLGHLRVRGSPAVFNSILLKITGWNILRVSVCAKMREIVYQRAVAAVLAVANTLIVGISAHQPRQRPPKWNYRPIWSYVSLLNTVPVAA